MRLQDLLARAVKNEDYDVACILRDRIAAGETEVQPHEPLYRQALADARAMAQQINDSIQAQCNCPDCRMERGEIYDPVRAQWANRGIYSRPATPEDMSSKPPEPHWRELDELRERYDKEVNEMLEKRLREVAPRASSRTVMQSLIAIVDKRQMTVEYTYKGRIILKCLFGEFGVQYHIR